MSVDEKKQSNGTNDTKSTEFRNKNFHLKDYIKDYVGHTKVRRLRFIAKFCPDVRVAALRAAITEAKRGRNHGLYTETLAQAKDLARDGVEDFSYDKIWVERTRRRSIDRGNHLETKLNNHKRNEDGPEEILASLKAVITHLQETGQHVEAQSRIMDCLDYAQSTADKLWARLTAIDTAAHLDFTGTSIVMQASRALELNKELGGNKKTEAKILAALGLHFVQNGNFSTAADRFKAVDFSLDCPSIISKRDVAIYGTLCAMASCKRAQLQANLLHSGEFKKFLNLVPGLTKMVQEFVQCRFKNAFDYLEKMKPDLQLDLYASKYLGKLFSKIHELAVVQYFSPFSHAKISRMAEIFGVNQSDMETRLVELIGKNKMQARIDNFNKVVIAKYTDLRMDTYTKALERGTSYVRDLKSLIMKMRLVKRRCWPGR